MDFGSPLQPLLLLQLLSFLVNVSFLVSRKAALLTPVLVRGFIRQQHRSSSLLLPAGNAGCSAKPSGYIQLFMCRLKANAALQLGDLLPSKGRRTLPS